MRIIDKNQDFYDYLQDSTDILVFDRRNSFLLTKEIMCNSISYCCYRRETKSKFALLQCGATFWLLYITITDMDNFYKSAKDYTLEVLSTWKNYDKINELLKLDIIEFNNSYKIYDYSIKDFDRELVKKNIKDLEDAVNHNDFRVNTTVSKYVKTTDYKGTFKREVKNIPLLKACGISSVIDPTNIFCAIEEYFSIEKMKSETTEAKGATNNDKIIMHGFDPKISFRKA